MFKEISIRFAVKKLFQSFYNSQIYIIYYIIILSFYIRFVDILNSIYQTVALIILLMTGAVVSLIGIRVSIYMYFLEKRKSNITVKK